MSTRDNFFRENGMEEEKFFSQMPQFSKEYGYKTKSNDKSNIIC